MTRPRPVHGIRAHVAIAAELVRLTLGGTPERPELLGAVLDDKTQHRQTRPRRRKR